MLIEVVLVRMQAGSNEQQELADEHTEFFGMNKGIMLTIS
jgi:hypothetical protein